MSLFFLLQGGSNSVLPGLFVQECADDHNALIYICDVLFEIRQMFHKLGKFVFEYVQMHIFLFLNAKAVAKMKLKI